MTSVNTDFNPEALVPQAVQHLEFLKTVDRTSKDLHQDHVIHNAIRRYETIWLPLLIRNPRSKMVAPPDVAWVWHVHMLCPTNYAIDCLAVVGCIPDHVFVGDHQLSQGLWASETDEPWLVNYDDIDTQFHYDPFYIKYDISNASKRQQEFYYNVSLPHFGDKNFLTRAHERYKMFVSLKRDNPGAFVVPAYDIDLIWHTHQLRPLNYIRDMQHFLGYVLEHDDSTTDRSAGSKLNEATTTTHRLWAATFPTEPYLVDGTLYRGPNPRNCLHCITHAEEVETFQMTDYMLLKSVQLDGMKDKYKISVTVSTMATGTGGEAFKMSEQLPQRQGVRVIWDDKVIMGFPWDARHDQDVVVKLYKKDGKWAFVVKAYAVIKIQVSCCDDALLSI